MKHLSIHIDGMSCSGCVNSVRKALARIPGVEVDQVEIGMATVAYDPAVTDPARVRAAIEQAGYQTPPA